ncbi:MAG: FKBP-type peptidyl-prolyl cis-trans isomerase [Bacteroidales bacterium]|jgi:FKBP-type peptidyl-prolyl cis-trans isomerase FklB|nr:FKBP-type peptidyl-prolyl cis-trans isomerase [Bacteroidales bacterium]
MNKFNLLALSAIIISGMLLVSCGGNTATPKASLKNDVDSISYAYGVSLAEQGLTQFLEQSGVIENSTNIQYEYQMKISAAEDSTEKVNLEKEMNTKIAELNKKNAPKLDQFLKGLKEALNASEEKTPYIQGLGIGNQIAEQMMPQLTSMVFAGDSTKKMNNDQIISGLFGALRNQELAMPKSDASEYVQNRVEQAQEESMRSQNSGSIEEGETFLAENAKRDEVIVLPSGLQYEVINEGTGELPVDGDQVKVHYHGTLLNGTVFDSSVDRGEPIVLGVNQVIPGWTEALKLMPVGSKWKLYIPYDLAYGAQGSGADIKPFSSLIFDVEVISIEK